MDTFEFDSDAFYFCTEIEPNNFIVTKAPKVDMSHYARVLDSKTTSSVEWTSSSLSDTTSSATTSSAHSPADSSSATQPSTSNTQPPPIPPWFTRECKNTLMMFGPQQPAVVMPSGHHFIHHSSLPTAPPPLTRDEIKSQLKSQLEFYFSRENLLTDKYLKCQMDEENYVPIQVLAGFRKVLSLTNDVELVAEALKESAILEVDASGEKVRANMKRTTIIIREIPEKFREEVVKLFCDGPPFSELTYGSNDSWYATFDNELETQVAYVAVQHKKNEITQRPVCARIKAGGPLPAAAPAEVRNGEKGRFAVVSSNGETGTIQMRELGNTLADFGFVPVATYRPGEPILSHFEYATPTFRFSGNSLGAFQQPPPQVPSPQHQFFYASPSSVSTTPRNFDELSTGSSTSTRTTASTYGRSVSRNGGGAANHQTQFNNESTRSNASNSNEWRARGGSDRRFQNSHHQNQENGGGSGGRHQNGGGRGGYRGGHRNGNNNYSNGHSNGWRSEQNGNSKHQNHGNCSGDNHQQLNGHRNGHQQSSSSSSSASSKYFSPEAVGSPINSVPSTPPPAPIAASSSSQTQQPFPVVTPTDLPTPPVWPAPNFDRRRKSSEASSTTVTANTATNTLTPSTPVTPPMNRPAFVESKLKESEPSKQELLKKEKLNGHPQPKSPPPPKKPETKAEKAKVQSPPVAPPAPTFSFEETAFPCLPKKPEPERKPQKPTFSSVVMGRRNFKPILVVPEKKTSYAEKLKQRQQNNQLLRH